MSEIGSSPRSKADARAAYDAISRWYDTLAGPSEERLHHRGLQALGPQPGERVLEIGFGTGKTIVQLARSIGRSGRVCGVDISGRMCDIAAARVRKAGVSDWVALHCGDAARLPFAAEAFDAAFMCFTLELFDTPEIPIVLGECRRILRRDGRLCTVSMARREGASVARSLYDWAHRTFPRFVDCRPIRAQQFLEASGLQALRVEDLIMWGLPVSIILSVKRP